MKHLNYIVLLVILFVSNVLYSQVSVIENDISILMKDYGAIGLSVAVVKDGKVIYTNSFGYKDREHGIPLCTNDLFRIASVSKTFVATVIMQLVEKGKLSLDDDVNKYLKYKISNPLYPDKPITVQMLLCHRSSINDSQGYKSFDQIISPSNSLSYKCYSGFEPGSKFDYCNLNYNLLGAIIEIVCGKRFDKCVRKKIIRPLGLHGSFNVLDLDSNMFVCSYRKQKDSLFLSTDTYLPFREKLDNYILGYTTPYISPAGGMKISITELAQYMVMHMNNGVYNKKRIISRESESILRKVPEKGHWYALSIGHYKNIIPGEELIGQTGGAYGVHTAMIFHPSKNYGFVVFCNGCKSQNADGGDLSTKVIRSLYKHLLM